MWILCIFEICSIVFISLMRICDTDMFIPNLFVSAGFVVHSINFMF